MEKNTIKPLSDNVLIGPIEAKKQTAQGIYLPANAENETPQEGKVIAIGESEKIKAKKGQLVIFRRFSGTEIKIENRKFLILKNEDILAVIE